MNKTILRGICLGFILTVIVACTAKYSDKYSETPPVALPPELADCKFFKIERSSAPTLNVVRCPNSSTSVNWVTNHGKSGSKHHTTITVDGVEYVKKQ